MKKALVVVIVFSLVLSLAGCAGSKKEDADLSLQKEIDSALQGFWEFSFDFFERKIGFKKGSIKVYYSCAFLPDDEYAGQYEINIAEEVIETTTSDEWLDDHRLEYSYNSKSGEVTLWLDGHQGKKVS